jgi:hypothetical protein
MGWRVRASSPFFVAELALHSSCTKKARLPKQDGLFFWLATLS